MREQELIDRLTERGDRFQVERSHLSGLLVRVEVLAESALSSRDPRTALEEILEIARGASDRAEAAAEEELHRRRA